MRPCSKRRNNEDFYFVGLIRMRGVEDWVIGSARERFELI
jgi:hypothetical protein